jgi:hypothetical protein
MTKKDILNKIKSTILGEASTTPGITVTSKVQKDDKKFNDEYYKDSNKKFKDYLGIEKDDFDAPKVNADEKQEKSYGGSGMEGLTYDNEGTEVAKKFTKRVADLNKPSKDYYLKKDEVNDVYSKLTKKAKSYNDEKKIYQNTPPVRAVEAKKMKSESTIKRLTYKTEFINESIVFNLIPEDFKKNDLVFEMTDGNKLMKIRWEGNKNGRPVVLVSKDSKKISNELDRMHQLFEYNPRNTFGKSNILIEDEELKRIIGESKNIDEENNVESGINGVTDSTDSTSTADQIGKKIADTSDAIVDDEIQTKITLPGVIASYNKKFNSWSIVVDKSTKNRPDTKETIISAIEQIVNTNKANKRIKPDLNLYLNKNKNVLGLDVQSIKDRFGLS